MKRLIVGVLLASCATAGPVVTTAVNVAEVCAVKATHDTAVNIIGDVGSALAAAAADWESAVAQLVTTWGIDAVKCAIAEVTNTSTTKAMASNDAIENLKAARGRLWLAGH